MVGMSKLYSIAVTVFGVPSNFQAQTAGLREEKELFLTLEITTLACCTRAQGTFDSVKNCRDKMSCFLKNPTHEAHVFPYPHPNYLKYSTSARKSRPLRPALTKFGLTLGDAQLFLVKQGFRLDLVGSRSAILLGRWNVGA